MAEAWEALGDAAGLAFSRKILLTLSAVNFFVGCIVKLCEADKDNEVVTLAVAAAVVVDTEATVVVGMAGKAAVVLAGATASVAITSSASVFSGAVDDVCWGRMSE